MTSRHSHIRRGIAVVGASLLAVTAGAGAGSAEQVGSWHDRFTVSHIEQEEHGEDFCGGCDYPVLFEADVQFNGHDVRRGDGLIYGGESANLTFIWTNTVTGEQWVEDQKGRSGDARVTDNGDGTLTITWAFRGTTTLRNDGELIARDAGLLSGQFVVDHGGTPGDPSDDEFVEDLGIIKVAGKNAPRDLCEDLHTFLD